MAFGLVIGLIVIWALTGLFFHFGNTWLLDIEKLSEADLNRIKARFERLARTARIG